MTFGTRYDLTHQLTPIERETLRLVACGLTNRQIAIQRGVHPGNVSRTVHIIFSKLHVCNRVNATRYALRHGIVTLDEACRVAGIGVTP